MDIVLFTHPSFLPSQSMPRYTKMLESGMTVLGHTVTIWCPRPVFYVLPAPPSFRKWLGYIDQFILFPIWVRVRLFSVSKKTLFVFVDQALGPWVPLVKHRPHVVHCHDFLALRSALGEIEQNPTSFSGRVYQRWIRRGFQQAKNFISVSDKTHSDLHRFLRKKPALSIRIHNGLNRKCERISAAEARQKLTHICKRNVSEGYLLHVGGNQWYKNRIAVVEAYTRWSEIASTPLPLLLVGPPPNSYVKEAIRRSPFAKNIVVLSDLTDETINHAYAGARLLFFPSLEEGFGWPIVEAMANACLVLTTEHPPMTEVGGDAAFYLPRMPPDKLLRSEWRELAARKIEHVLNLSATTKQKHIKMGLVQIAKFDSNVWLQQTVDVYQKVLNR